MDRRPEDYVKGLVSVITPVFNCEKYIDRTLNSVFDQTYKEIEIVLVDDRSTDRSAEIINGYQDEHPEIVYFLQPENKGAGYARNKALELAQGQYVAFLDADDLWKPDKIEKQVELLKRKGGGFCFTAMEVIRDDGTSSNRIRKVESRINYKQLLKNTMIGTSTVLIDRYYFGDFRMHLRRGGQDYATWLKLLRNTEWAYGLNEPLTKYRESANSLSSNKIDSIRQVFEIQVYDEKINSFCAAINTMCFIANAIRKRRG